MSTRIHKFKLPTVGVNVIPANVVRWLGVGYQGTMLCAWAEVITPVTSTKTVLHVALTGEEPPASVPGMRTEYVGSAHRGNAAEGFEVLHVYRVWP